MPTERLSMIGARMSRALDIAAKMAPTKDEVINLMYEYEFLDQVPQPYREMLINADRYLRGEDDEIATTPMPSFKRSAIEIADLYRLGAEAKGLNVTTVAVKARVSTAKVRAFYAAEPMPTVVRQKIEKALSELGVVVSV
jgi:hypothetical protein